MEVTVSAPPEYTIAFTTDGTIPTKDNDSGLSSVVITVKSGGSGYLTAHRDLMLIHEFNQDGFFDDETLPSGTVLTAALFDGEGRMSEPVTKVYYPGVDFAEAFPGCLVISVTTDPENLLDYDTGILATGAVYDEWKQTEEGKEAIQAQERWHVNENSTEEGRAWERPVWIQIYDTGSEPAVECAAGIRVCGGDSRTKVQKSFNFYFRGSYGDKYLRYPLFPGNDLYKSFSLKAGGGSSDFMKYRRGLLGDLVKDRRFTVLESRPAVLFLNGEYWGPYCLSEKISDYTLQCWYGVDAGQVVIIKDRKVEEGAEADIELYRELMSFAKRDLSDPEIYSSFCEVMDIESMADYFATQIYIGNADWGAGGNDMLWRTRDASFNGGRWQYILYDIEYSAGLYGSTRTQATVDHFQRVSDNYPLFAAAVRNREFFDLFLAAIREIGSECYGPERVRQEVESMKAVWDPLMIDYYKRYGDSSRREDNETKKMIDFFDNRYDIIIPIIESWGEAQFNDGSLMTGTG